MALDPIKTFTKLDESYREFLNSQFTFRNPKIDFAAKKALAEECALLKALIFKRICHTKAHTLCKIW